MERIQGGIIRHHRWVLIGAVLACVVSVFLMSHTRIEYDMTAYLPKDAPTSRALQALGDAPMPNLRAFVPDITPQQALQIKRELQALPGVSAVIWLDDVVDMTALPWEMIPETTRAAYHSGNGALFQMTVGEDAATVLDGMRAAYPGTIFQGEAANNAQLVNVSMGEVSSLMYYLLPLVLIILLLSTRHWFEPVLFLLAIGVAIVINEGTNIVLGSVSFVTQACSAVLQLAVSIDYAVFLLHRFGELREQGLDPETAMRQTMKSEAGTIAASAMTTVFGFLALLFMDFGMGFDMGIVLAKGVLLSYLSVMVFLPALAVTCSKLIDKTTHRSFMPSFTRFGGVVTRRGKPLALIALLLLPLAFMGQQRNQFQYGSGGMHSGQSPVRQEAEAIEAVFGRSVPMLLLVPNDQPGKMNVLTDALTALPGITSVTSYASTAGTQIPRAVLPRQATDQLSQGMYDRIILDSSSEDEGSGAFALVEAVRAAAQGVYGDDYHLISESGVNYDLRNTITGDYLEVLLLGMLAIGLVLLITFRNMLLPFVLLVVLEGAIWLNMSVPYFLGYNMNYIGYQIVSSVQLGATIDYAILLTQRYLQARRTLPKREAAAHALSRATGPIMTPASILILAGYLVSFVVTSNGIISQMGEIIGRGALTSAAMVLLVLPHVLMWLDKPIRKAFFRKTKGDFVE